MEDAEALWYIRVANNHLHSIIQQASCIVNINTGITKFSEIVSEVRKGCIFSPFLFITLIDVVKR